MLTGDRLVLLVAWATVVGVDLVSFPQALLSRPLVAAAVAGLLCGDPETGLRVGAVLELFALDVLPVGAARYPDYGAATVGAVAFAAMTPWPDTLGLATLYGLLFAALGGLTLRWHREGNGRAVHRAAAGLAAGEVRVITALHYRGLAWDGIRSGLLGLVAVGGALALRRWVAPSPQFAVVSVVAIGAGLAAAVGGALRSAGRGARGRWVAAGAVGGFLLVLLR